MVTLEEILLGEDYSLEVGYDTFYKCWRCHINWWCKDEGPHNGCWDGCEGRGTTPSAAVQAAYEAMKNPERCEASELNS